MVVDDVQRRGASTVIIDSISGYVLSMPREQYLVLLLHELLTFLGQKRVTTVLVSGQHGFMQTAGGGDLDISYLADSVLLLRYYEHQGEVRQAISAFKRRMGPHERSIRELRISHRGIEVGEPLRHFHGVLPGAPVPQPSSPRHETEEERGQRR